MQFSKTVTYLLFMLLTLTACQGGSSDDMPTFTDDESGKVYYLKLSLLTNSEATTRSNPTGGEEGDGREAALERENRIYDLNLFFYRSVASGDGMNLDKPENIPVEHHEYISSESIDGFPIPDNEETDNNYTTLFNRLIPIYDYEPMDGDWVIVIANAGKIEGKNNLGHLREGYFISACWNGSIIKEITRFTMSTARTDTEDGKVIVTDKDGSTENPFTVSTVIERTAARIDFYYNDNDKDDSNVENGSNVFLTYKVKDGNTPTGSKVKITHIMPVNLNAVYPYYFKRVTIGFKTDQILVCRDETPSSGKPTNYVLERNTLTETGKSFTNAASDIKNGTIGFSDNYKVKSIRTNGESEKYPWESFDTYSILCYANENTHIGTDYFTSEYLTGLAFRALYVPQCVYKSASVDSKGELTDIDDSWSQGKDFWRFTPSRDGSGNDVGESGCKYFSSADAAEAYKAANPELNGIITEYTDGVCYYNLWLKHADYDSDSTDPQELFPMQYGIVRNNIYRVGVSFSGPGDAKPMMDGPINMRSKIYVRKWNQRQENEIVF